MSFLSYAPLHLGVCNSIFFLHKLAPLLHVWRGAELCVGVGHRLDSASDISSSWQCYSPCMLHQCSFEKVISYCIFFKEKNFIKGRIQPQSSLFVFLNNIYWVFKLRPHSFSGFRDCDCELFHFWGCSTQHLLFKQSSQLMSFCRLCVPRAQEWLGSHSFPW